jgi:type 1 glutamine amidotransferase
MRVGLLACTIALVLGLVGTAAGADTKSGAKRRLLVITESKGFRHGCVTRGKNDELSLVEKTLIELGNKTGDWEAVCTQNSREALTAENLKKFDAVFFYTTGSLPISDVQKADLLAFVRSGKGFSGSHSATDTFYDWKEYGELIGAYFDGHPWHQLINVTVEDKNNPATKHLGDSFKITDEIYQFKGPYSRNKLHILLRLDMASVKNAGNRKDNDNALAWTHEYGKGRVFYTALGHRDEVWRDPRFQQHMIGGLRYVLGLANADATPSGGAAQK